MRRVHIIIGYLMLLLLPAVVSSCVDEDQYADNPRGNFEALWRIIDEHYSFFDYKAGLYGLDWNEVYARFSPQISDDMTNTQLFEVLGNMLKELRDGHVNLYSGFDIARNWSFHEDYPANYSRSEEHTSELQSRQYLVCRLLLEKKKYQNGSATIL